MSGVIGIPRRGFSEFFRGAGRTGSEDLLHAARVLLWVRWLGLIAALVEIHYRVDYGSLSHILNTLYCLGFLTANGYVQWLIHRRGTVKPAWLLGLSALDLAVISFSTAISGGFNSPYFPAYYFAVAVFAYVFTAPRLVLPWTTLVVVIYSVLSFTVEPGLDLAGKEEQHLFYRVVALYAVAAVVSIIAGLERASRHKGLERERELQRREAELQRQRIELSQSIHDTTAQWAYMVGLGVEQATELVEESNKELRAKLRLVADLSRSAMWDLRHPIDGGQIFRGGGAGRGPGGPRRHLHRHHLGAGGVPPPRCGAGPVHHNQESVVLHRPQRPDQRGPPRQRQPGWSSVWTLAAGSCGCPWSDDGRGTARGLREPGPRVQEHAGRRPADGRSS